MMLHEDIAKIASLIGDKSRAKILTLLMEGKSFTAGELAIGANISAQTASNHLLKLSTAGIVECKPFGRHRYYSLSSEKVASLLESLGVISKDLNSNKLRQKSIDKDICNARTCYDHFAGKISVMYTKRLLKNNYIEVNGDQFDITLKGIKYFSELGIDVDILTKKKRNFAKQCLDWTEREYHISGSLGQAILTFLLDNRMLIKSKKKSRVLVLTVKGKKWFSEQ